MKKYLLLSFILILAVSIAFIAGCGSGATSGGGSSSGGANMVTLTGKIVSLSAGQSTSSSGYQIYLVSKVLKKIVIFNCNGGYWIANVSGEVFTGEAEAGRPVGIIFAGSIDGSTIETSFLGSLSMGSSIDSIPLNLDNGSAIDLKSLFWLGTNATCEYDPIGDALTANTISTFDVTAMSFGNEMFSSIIKHPDADHNGQVDILETTPMYYRPYFMYTVAGGNFSPSITTSGVATGAAGTSANITNNNFCLDVSDSDGGSVAMPTHITIHYPNTTDAYDASAIGGSVTSSTRCFYSLGGGDLGATGAPTDGDYTVPYKTKMLTFEITGQTATKEIALIVPTVTVSGGNLEKISWAYRLGGGSGAEMHNPGSLVEAAQIIIWNGSGPTRIYETGFTIPPNTKEHVLSPQILWSDVSYINMIYIDHYGNHVISSWSK